jgi:hypothetical protein
MDDRTGLRNSLSILLAAALWLALFLWLLDPSSTWPPHAPPLRILLALVLAALSALVALPGRSRRGLAGWLFFVVICTGVVRYGDMIGLRAAWQRWLVGLVLSSPFIYLVFTASPRRQRGQRVG